jgi:acetyl-CoA C-acetyltransferase
LSAPGLGGKIVAEAARRAGIDAKEIDEAILGNVVQAGLGQNPARQAALNGGCDPRVAALTINKVCGSGLKAVALAAQAVTLGESEIIVAGGMESMSNCPYLLPQARSGYRIGNGVVVDSMVHDGLWDAYEDFHMGMTGELVAEKYAITRQEQDKFAFEIHQKAVRARKSCFFESQILPIEVPQKKGEPLLIKYDESPREDTSLEALAKLKPAFKKDGTVTAGNAPGTNDGAAALIVTSERNASRLAKTPIARIVAQAVSGVEPKWVMMAPVDAVEKLLTKTGLHRDKDVDLVELSTDSWNHGGGRLDVTRQPKLNPEKVNVNGGAVAIGHPIGASGARILVTLLYELERRNLGRGIAALCPVAERCSPGGRNRLGQTPNVRRSVRMISFCAPRDYGTRFPFCREVLRTVGAEFGFGHWRW